MIARLLSRNCPTNECFWSNWGAAAPPLAPPPRTPMIQFFAVACVAIIGSLFYMKCKKTEKPAVSTPVQKEEQHKTSQRKLYSMDD